MNLTQKLTLFLSSLVAVTIVLPVQALDDSTGEPGINVLRLQAPPYNLTGRKIGLGQVEVGRPGRFGFDKITSVYRSLGIAGIFLRDTPAKANEDVDEHATMVAAVMVSRDKRLRGVAPGAKLYSSAVGSLEKGAQPEECLSSQYIARQHGDDVRAINFSFGEPLRRDPRANATLDGNALLTMCVDWSSRVHNVLYVIAGNQGSGGIPIPTDNYNGVNVASSARRDGLFAKVDFSNLSSLPVGIGRSLIMREINSGARRAINLVSPGTQIQLYTMEGRLTRVTGTSFATPHVTASVAILQEWGDRQIAANTPNWSLDARRSEVMKAVLLNSADKIKDTGDGLLLGMERTVLAKNNATWLDGDAYQDDKIPLDIQMGTGHLNVNRAFQQFSSGQWGPDTPVPPVAWDYRTVDAGNVQEYVLDKPLQKGSYAAVTLAWQRVVELNDRNRNEVFDVGEDFRDRGLNDLNIYLIPADSNNVNDSVCASISEVDSVEHIFCPVPRTGRYKIRVEYRQEVNERSQPYALAWWTKG